MFKYVWVCIFPLVIDILDRFSSILARTIPFCRSLDKFDDRNNPILFTPLLDFRVTKSAYVNNFFYELQ